MSLGGPLRIPASVKLRGECRLHGVLEGQEVPFPGGWHPAWHGPATSNPTPAPWASQGAQGVRPPLTPCKTLHASSPPPTPVHCQPPDEVGLGPSQVWSNGLSPGKWLGRWPGCAQGGGRASRGRASPSPLGLAVDAGTWASLIARQGRPRRCLQVEFLNLVRNVR